MGACLMPPFLFTSVQRTVNIIQLCYPTNENDPHRRVLPLLSRVCESKVVLFFHAGELTSFYRSLFSHCPSTTTESRIFEEENEELFRTAGAVVEQ